MKLKRIISIVLILAVLALPCQAFAAGAGSSSDPLVTKSYVVGTFKSSVMSAGRAMIDTAIDAAAFIFGAPKGTTTGSFKSFSVAPGGSIAMDLGDSVVLVSGAATISITRGTVLDLTTGQIVANNSALLPYNRYFAAEDTTAKVNVTASSLFTADGSVTVTGESTSASPFTDVLEGKWYYDYVINAVKMGLVNGKTATTYEPGSNLRISEAVKLAACLHQLYYNGAVTLTISGSPWYSVYVEYAISNGIIEGTYADYTVDITREEFVHILYHSMPESDYTAINNVHEGTIPDVAMSDPYAQEIYNLYRAGILTGDDEGYFHAGDNILRSEVATILYRMYQPDSRRTVDLGQKNR